MTYLPLVRAEIDLNARTHECTRIIDRAFRLIGRGNVFLKSFIDDRFSLTDADEAFETVLADHTCKLVSEISEFWE